MEKRFLPGDIVRYGFGTPQIKKSKGFGLDQFGFDLSNTVCVVGVNEECKSTFQTVYDCLYVCGDWKFEGTHSIRLDYSSDNELLFSFHPELHTKEIINASS